MAVAEGALSLSARRARLRRMWVTGSLWGRRSPAVVYSLATVAGALPGQSGTNKRAELSRVGCGTTIDRGCKEASMAAVGRCSGEVDGCWFLDCLTCVGWARDLRNSAQYLGPR